MPKCARCGQPLGQEEWVLVPLNNDDLDVLAYHPACHAAEEAERALNDGTEDGR